MLTRFISKLTPRFLYRFLKSIQLKRNIKKTEPGKLKLVLGAGGLYDEGWIPTGIETIDIPNEKDWNRYFKKNSISAVLAEHVWEHLNESASLEGARIIYNYLKPGGYFRIAVPDGFHPSEEYIKGVDVDKDPQMLKEHHSHKVLYNYQTLSKVFTDAGFEVSLLEYWDENRVFHDSEWDPKEGKIFRSARYKFEKPEVSILGMKDFTSLIIDARKKI